MLVVIAIVAILAALLLPVLSKVPMKARGAQCQNNLHQTGLAVEMYISDHSMYPPGLDAGPPVKAWPDFLAAYNPVSWTNAAWQCPTYIAEGGTVIWNLSRTGGKGFVLNTSCSYAYNADGIVSYKSIGKRTWVLGSPPLGLGDLNLKVPDNQVVAPSEMYAIGDSRPGGFPDREFRGGITMQPWELAPSALHAKYTEAKPPHANGYNLLFADGHVGLVKRRDYLYPPRSAQNWNRDHQPHPELWAPANEWAVQN
ncbi:MAG TPA: DUF1559 domain-containing protein [Verrucomicrobiae bacterium]|nr:DUF1559 domain-containing protein [Verrucomicrobiae bacterium]